MLNFHYHSYTTKYVLGDEMESFGCFFGMLGDGFDKIHVQYIINGPMVPKLLLFSSPMQTKKNVQILDML